MTTKSSGLLSIYFVTALVLVHVGLGVEKRILGMSRAILNSFYLRFGVVFLLVITVVNLQMRTDKWPHWSLGLILFG